MSIRKGLQLAYVGLCAALIGCGGARKQVSTQPETPISMEPVAKFATIVEIVSGPTQLTFDDANNGLGSYHPDGAQVIFQSDRDGRWQLYSLSLADGTESLFVGSDANDENPMWLPDSSGVLFVSDRNHPGEEFSRDIFFYDPASIQTASLTEEPADDWFPVPINSDSYYFLSERGAPSSGSQFDIPNNLFRGSLDGSPPVLVAGLDVNPSAPADLEEGRLLVRTNEGRLASLSSEGDVSIISPASLFCGTVSYSHVRKLAAVAAREDDIYGLYLFDTESKTWQPVDTGEGEVRFPQFSPDGNRILFSKEMEGKFQLFQVELAQ